jgi:catechol 2,3-dioxygenase-like lactoylglutathione lyase family enzyme
VAVVLSPMATSQIDLSTCRIGPAAAVADMARARAFYEGPLGLTAEEQQGGAVTYAFGSGTQLVIYPSPENAGTSKATLAGIEVPDVEAAVEDLTARGVTFEQYAMGEIETDARGVADLGGFKSAWFKDPDGNIFAIAGG